MSISEHEPTPDAEIAEAAAEAAAEAVMEVQEEQRQEEALVRAQTEAFTAEITAEIAEETAERAEESAEVALEVAVTALEVAEETAAASEEAGPCEHCRAVDERLDNFIAESREFFARIEGQQETEGDGVETVEVNHSSSSSTSTEHTDAAPETGASQKRSGRRFGANR